MASPPEKPPTSVVHQGIPDIIVASPARSWIWIITPYGHIITAVLRRSTRMPLRWTVPPPQRCCKFSVYSRIPHISCICAQKQYVMFRSLIDRVQLSLMAGEIIPFGTEDACEAPRRHTRCGRWPNLKRAPRGWDIARPQHSPCTVAWRINRPLVTMHD